jgi:RNA polymerase sigma-70 factor (ECF subfamily)
VIDGADEEKGRFRTYLLTVLKRFLIDRQRMDTAIKRGGRSIHISLDWDGVEDACKDAISAPLTPEQAYNKQWVITIVDRARSRLRDECAKAGKLELFDALSSHLTQSRPR